LCLRTEVTAGQAASVVVIEMRAYKDRFRFELTAEGSDQPTRVLLNDKVIARAPGGILPVGRAVRVQAANVDHTLMLLAGGRRVAMAALAAETTPEGDLRYEPTRLSEAERDRFDDPSGDEPRAMACEVRVGARAGPASLAYLRLDRDVYYLSRDPSGRELFPGNSTQGKPFPVSAGEYFVCGDNSPKSFDSRLWPTPEHSDMRPVVPRRNLVGKAFFVYWPSAGPRYAIPVRVVPDVTGFRFVH
jgi:hypothetical protein